MTADLIDLLVVISANVFNIVVLGIMLVRIPGWKKAEKVIGLFDFVLLLPLGLALIFNLLDGRPWWMVLIPGLMIVYLLVEIALDYVFHYPFRQTRWLGPYLGLFYISQWMLIGYAFVVSDRYGFVTLATYFLGLGATALSYKKVGHGDSASAHD